MEENNKPSRIITARMNFDVFLTGYFYSDTMSFDTINLINDTTNNSSDIFIAKLNSSTITKLTQEDIHISYVKAFPNPFTDKITFTLKDEAPSEIILYNILSFRILQQKFSKSATFNTEHLPVGIYFYELRNKKGQVQKGKIVKE